MPSIHFAITFLLVWLAVNQRKRWRILAWTYALSMGIALVYMGEHYVIDIIAGGAVTSAGWMLARIWTERVSPSLIARRITRPGWSSRQPLPS